MIFKRKEILHPYSFRLGVLNGVEDYNSILKKYLIKEPHTLLNIGHAINFFKINNKTKNALSIGICPIKEWSLINENIFKKITVYDLDKKMILKGNEFWKRKKIPIEYKFRNILTDGIELEIYNSLILFQMDYIFSDSELKNILSKAKSAGISECLVITPSLFNLNTTKNLNLIFHEIANLILYIYQGFKISLFSKSENKSNKLTLYRRTYSHFINIFSKNGFKIKKKKIYLNPNGSFNLLYFLNKSNNK